ncbi:11925_t:CDS:2 [Funneliformis caledonium]|uniref:11925_t:CDS:1 n=1 Tax=Funneliformis caledonium TaxID=1117310 RepID=A0A9N8Z7X8_9GLOM|nr:11925_t:CDS:2 [Funneliformis caledonium]
MPNKSSFSIIDIRKNKIINENFINEILDGLNSKNSIKSIPTVILYDSRGLQLFDQITYLDEYYLTSAELNVLRDKVDRIIEYIPDGSSVIELGAGSLRKTKLILQSLEKSKKNITYYALDLMEDELIKSLSSLGKFSNVQLVGLLGTYEEGMDFAASLPEDVPKMIMWLGSSIGNSSREEGAEFIKSFQTKAMNPGDLFLIGIDRRNHPDKVTIAYNDPKGITAEFILNGLDHVNVILDQPLIDRNDFDYFARYNEDVGRHEAYYKAKKDITLEYTSPSDNTKMTINLKKDELIHIEYSYKYSKEECFALFHDSRLSHLESWPDPDSQYDLHLIYKSPFYFTRNVESQGSIPTVEEWKELWKSWDTVTMTMISRELVLERSIELRHPFIFYLGHVPAFLDINLARYFKEEFTEPRNFADIFERGIDPDMDDPTNCHQHSTVPDEWPSYDSIISYRDKVRQRIISVYDAYKEKVMPRSLGRVVWMTFEHEAMHLETILYMLIQWKNTVPPKGVVIPRWKASLDPVPKANLITIPAQTITLGHDDNESADDTDPLSLPFGWDNERPSRQVTVKSFRIQSRPITNGEYLDFMEKTINKGYPASWIPVNPSLFTYKVRTVFGPVDMDVARNWPVLLSQDRACRYAEWAKMRLPTEEELRSFYDLNEPQLDLSSNIGFSHWHPVDVPHDKNVVQTVGSGWEWTSTEFSAHPGFNKSKLYPGYSSDFFDSKHVVILGGSWATHPRITRRSFRNWYQRGYPYMFCSARLCQI